ncbi:hypothetical protein MTO96_043075, partial [Rhipicephalus appendiculatus]
MPPNVAARCIIFPTRSTWISSCGRKTASVRQKAGSMSISR